LYGQRAPEWLSADLQRVVTELLQRLERLEQRGRARQARERRHGTRTENHSRSRQQRRAPQPSRSAGADPRRVALAELGLEPGASPEAIRRAYRRLAKAHHPDLGGDVVAFHHLDAAYRLLLGSP
jgi:DnaJ-domain-containing protein 1